MTQMTDHHALCYMSRLGGEIRDFKSLDCELDVHDELGKEDLNQSMRVSALDHIILLDRLIGFDSVAI